MGTKWEHFLVAPSLGVYNPDITVDGLTSLLEGGKKPPEDTLFTRQESAARARLSLSTLDRLIKSGDLEVVRIRHSIRIRKSALDALLQGSENAESGTPGIDSRKNTT